MLHRREFLNVSVWSKHFPEQTAAYAAKLGDAAAKAGARVINVQLDEPPSDLSSQDAGKRRACLEATKKWINLAKYVAPDPVRAIQAMIAVIGNEL